MHEEAKKHESYKIIETGAQAEILEKKSRFIATVRAVKSEEEAAAFVGEMRKRYWDAKHHCLAYVLGQRAQITRCSDDGEPGGTAGRPILETLLASGVRDAAIVVTRYFGGTLLGTGGLVRAYTQAAQAGLAASVTADMVYGSLLKLCMDYTMAGKIQYLCANEGIAAIDSAYAQDVAFTVFVPLDRKDAFVKALTEISCGKMQIEEVERLYYKDRGGPRKGEDCYG